MSELQRAYTLYDPHTQQRYSPDAFAGLARQRAQHNFSYRSFSFVKAPNPYFAPKLETRVNVARAAVTVISAILCLSFWIAFCVAGSSGDPNAGAWPFLLGFCGPLVLLGTGFGAYCFSGPTVKRTITGTRTPDYLQAGSSRATKATLHFLEAHEKATALNPGPEATHGLNLAWEEMLALRKDAHDGRDAVDSEQYSVLEDRMEEVAVETMTLLSVLKARKAAEASLSLEERQRVTPSSKLEMEQAVRAELQEGQLAMSLEYELGH